MDRFACVHENCLCLGFSAIQDMIDGEHVVGHMVKATVMALSEKRQSLDSHTSESGDEGQEARSYDDPSWLGCAPSVVVLQEGSERDKR
jgi:hypothetical protein